MSTVTQSALAATPRVNLLPPEIAEARTVRKLRGGLAAAAVASLAVAGLLFVAAGHDVDQAQQKLDASTARSTQLQAQTAKYAEVPLVIAQVEAAQAQVSQAMGQEVRWSYVLNDLSLTIPKRVWLTTMTVSQNVDQVAGAPVVAPDPLTPVGLGTVTFEGRAYRHNDLAAFLESLAKQKGYTSPYFSDSTVEAVGDRDNAVKFSSTVTLTDDALSGRWTPKAGS